MLCLSRGPGEKLLLFDRDGEPLGELTINRIRTGQVSIGFDGPGSERVKVLRAELEKQEAA